MIYWDPIDVDGYQLRDFSGLSARELKTVQGWIVDGLIETYGDGWFSSPGLAGEPHADTVGCAVYENDKLIGVLVAHSAEE